MLCYVMLYYIFYIYLVCYTKYTVNTRFSWVIVSLDQLWTIDSAKKYRLTETSNGPFPTKKGYSMYAWNNITEFTLHAI